MIVQEKIIVSDKVLIKTYSDMNVYIKQVETENEFIEAVDLESANYTYVETNKPIVDELSEEFIEA